MKKIGMVISRCDEKVVGGSESLAWQWAMLLKDRYEVDVLTTTALDLATWKNARTPGKEKREGVTIYRFTVSQGRTAYWHELHKLLLKKFRDLNITEKQFKQMKYIPWTLALQEEFIFKQGPYSKGLTDFLSEHWLDYKVIIFFTYLYPITYWGMREVPRDRCLLVPTLHHEAPAYFLAYKYMARKARVLLWNTGAEQELGKALWGDVPGRIVGMGINTGEFKPAQLGYPYLLYCGRIDPYKGGRQLIEYFLKYKQENPTPLRLVLTGKDELGLPNHPDIEFRGFVSEEEKFRLMAGALLFVMPSPHESLSIVILEAMAQRTPVLVNQKSEVLVDHIRKSAGGFLYEDYRHFSTAINDFLKDPLKKRTMGEKARGYVTAHYGEERIKGLLLEVIEGIDDLKTLQWNWDELGKSDAFGNILTDPLKKGKWTREEFFKKGEEEIFSVMSYIDSLNIKIPRKRALDFGCGVGRVTQALCLYFEQCLGVDIAPSMIEFANRYNQHEKRCQYYLNESDDLQRFEDNSFDFIYSNVVLQHIKPRYSKEYIKEFIRVLAPGGLILFQIPSKRTEANYTVPVDSPPTDPLKASQPLPNPAFNAEITLFDVPATMKAGLHTYIHVRIRNNSPLPWPSSGEPDGRYRINLGNHWLDQEKKRVIHDDGRLSLPKDLEPSEEVDLFLPVIAPPKPDVYFLELDMVQEGVAWFKEKGSRTTAVRIQVEKAGSSEDSFPKMDMYGIKKEEVTELIRNHGGRMIDVQEYNVCGEEWLSYRYCVTKS